MNLPCFAVVGHPNKGKSSIVATLAQDDNVVIERVSGSTKACGIYPMSVDGKVLYELVDTPGFQRARAVFAWLEENCSDASQRSATIKKFCEQHSDNKLYRNECELLKPLIEGAGIIYVVDGSRPYGPEYEAEMEILRWTGRPSMALINPIENTDYVTEWENALEQFFRTVRVFNAHRAEFKKRIELLSVFGQLVQEWNSPLTTAVDNLKFERAQQQQHAAETISDLLVEILQYCETKRVPDGLPTKPVEKILTQKYQLRLAREENKARRTIEQIFSHYRLKKEEKQLAIIDNDLFDQSQWYLFGLSKKQLIATATGAGASAGALIDIGLGGSSLFLGAFTGGAVAGASAWLFSDKIAKLSFKGIPTGGQLLQYGPSTHPNFPFVILGRALFHYKSVCQRAHANQTVLNLEGSNPFDSVLAKDRIVLMRIFKNIRNNKKIIEQKKALNNFITNLLMQIDES